MSHVAPSPVRRSSARGWRLVAQVVGELLVTLGVLLLLLVAYQLWWTNVLSDRAADTQRAQIEASWAAPEPVIPTPTPTGPSPSPTGPTPTAAPTTTPAPSQPSLGDGFALMYIPRLRGSVWGEPVVHGVNLADLAEGIGHYPDTALPGQVGNFAVAAHRATHGEPFRDIDQLRAGDEVVVETRDTWYVYRLDRDRIVLPDAVWVIDPVPGEPTAKPTRALVTLTTCNPRWASYERWIWWGELTQTLPKSQGEPAALSQGG